MISFCITCLNRLYQLKQTLPVNLKNNDPKYVEFILVDFNSNDGLKKYIYKNFRKELKSNYLKFYSTNQLKYWNASIAKNTAHILANNSFIVNLDCDNFTGQDGGKKLLDIHNDNPNSIIHQTDFIRGSGNTGRISLSKDNFIKLGGYNESFYPSGYNDPDLINRAIAFNIKYISWTNVNYNQCIKNSKEENIKNCNSNLNWEQMNRMNKLISEFNIENQELVANKHKKKLGISI